MDQILTYQFLGFFQAEWSTVLAILGIGTIYFLAPVLGYEASRRTPLAAAMWALIVKIGVGLFRTSLLFVNATFSYTPFRSPNYAGGLFGDLQQTLMMILTPAETAIFMGAMILFVLGLQRLRRRPQALPG
jgi:hypothetical protein